MKMLILNAKFNYYSVPILLRNNLPYLRQLANVNVKLGKCLMCPHIYPLSLISSKGLLSKVSIKLHSLISSTKGIPTKRI